MATAKCARYARALVFSNYCEYAKLSNSDPPRLNIMQVGSRTFDNLPDPFDLPQAAVERSPEVIHNSECIDSCKEDVPVGGVGHALTLQARRDVLFSIPHVPIIHSAKNSDLFCEATDAMDIVEIRNPQSNVALVAHSASSDLGKYQRDAHNVANMSPPSPQSPAHESLHNPGDAYPYSQPATLPSTSEPVGSLNYANDKAPAISNFKEPLALASSHANSETIWPHGVFCGLEYVCDWGACSAVISGHKAIADHIDGHAKRNPARCCWGTCREQDIEDMVEHIKRHISPIDFCYKCTHKDIVRSGVFRQLNVNFTPVSRPLEVSSDHPSSESAIRLDSNSRGEIGTGEWVLPPSRFTEEGYELGVYCRLKYVCCWGNCTFVIERGDGDDLPYQARIREHVNLHSYPSIQGKLAVCRWGKCVTMVTNERREILRHIHTHSPKSFCWFCKDCNGNYARKDARGIHINAKHKSSISVTKSV
ncbi:hypothetical protein Hypma_014377 [Hypsizygus marmoreus]|uniref:C2H2-type domain-containing protein n=1 Tax=Hypsizygus marmoreus TaxID=39966 RepID=A0A369JC83_HYPMA|nr:hypothetical protein Hypma_014377 [Hypsizygus marmoreus]